MRGSALYFVISTPERLIFFLHTLPPELVLFFTFITTALSLFFSARFFGKTGLYLYSVLALLIGNIQVLKGVQLSLWENPVALGTIVFSSTFVVSDVLTECYGRRAALKSVGLGFGACLVFTVLMILTLGVHPLEIAPPHPDYHFVQAHHAMEILFLPAPRLLLASLIAYVCSQVLDILIFERLKRFASSSLLGRSSLSTATAFLLDNIIFSVLAWVAFSPTPVSWESLIWTYILGTYALRLLVSVLFLPLVSTICRFLKESSHA